MYTYHTLSCEFCSSAWKKVYSIHRYMIQFGNDLWWVGVYHHQWYFLTRYRWNNIWGKRPPNNENMFSIKNTIISMMSVSKNILFESVFFLPKKCLFLKQDIYLKQSLIYYFTLHWGIFVQRTCSLCSNDNTAAHVTYHQSSMTGDSSRTWTAYLFFAFKPLYFSSLL